MTSATILAFPTHRTLRLVNLAGVEFARAGFPVADRDPGAPWEWIVETVGHELDAWPDSIGCTEGPDGEDFVTVDGIPVYRIFMLTMNKT